MKMIDRGGWTAHVSALASSNLSRAEYCRQHGLRYNQMIRWQSRLAKAGVSKKSKAFLLAKVAPRKTQADLSSGTCARIVTRSGAALELGASADPRWIALVIAELGGLAP